MTDRAVPELPDPRRFAVRQIYAGGEGTTALVADRANGGATAVLKVLPAGATMAEASLLVSLQHPAIPRVLETGRTGDGRPWLLREHAEGRPLQETFPLSPEAAAALARDLLEVLAYVHLRGVLHLDLKPQNVLHRDADPHHVLLDFGLGRRGIGQAQGGTPFFAAPELLLGLAPDARADLFSLGALLFVALRASAAPLPLQRFLARFPRDDFFAALGARAQDLPAPFDMFLPRLLARRPQDRFPDAQEALEALAGGSGRPSLALLRPDPVALYQRALDAALAELRCASEVAVTGAEPSDRQALALHLACTLPGARAVEVGPERCVVRRADHASHGALTFAIPPLDEDQLAAHLERAMELDAGATREGARWLLARGAREPASIERTLLALAQQDRIVPAGMRWIWPDAAAGRLALDDAVPAARCGPVTAALLEQTAANGHIERALDAYRRAARAADAARDAALREGLARGLLRAGEPARALPFVHDLPLLRARALLALGHVRQAQAQLELVPRAAPGHEDDMIRIRAELAHSRGDLVTSEELLGALVERGGATRDRVSLGALLVTQHRGAEASVLLGKILADVQEPFLRAAALANLGEAQRQIGNLEQARRRHQEALDLYQSLGNARASAIASSNLGVIAKDLGDFEEAIDHLRRSRALFVHANNPLGAARTEASIGIVDLEAGDARLALERLGSAAEQLEGLGALEALPRVRLMLARAHAALGHRQQAVEMLALAGPLEDARDRAEAAKVHDALRASAAHGDILSRHEMPQDRSMAGGAMIEQRPEGSISREVFRTFLAVNRRLAGEADLERAMRYLLDAAVTLSGGRVGYLLVSRPGGLRLELRTGEQDAAATAFSRTLVNRALQQRRALTADDVLSDKELLEMPSIQGLRVRSAVCVPFVSASGTEGALYVEHPGRPGVFGPAEKEHLEVLADQAAIAVDRMLHEERLAQGVEQSRRELAVVHRTIKHSPGVVLIGRSRVVDQLRKQITKIAGSDLAVLVRGETGTGKELVARSIHQQSARTRGPFVAENCSAIPAELMESELFGHVKGAFTGADQDRAGLFELSSGGTLFLDEVGDMPLPFQAKLLRALAEGQVRRVGGTGTMAVNVRLITATHKDLATMIEKGEFRADLYYRIAAVEIVVPPLRDRAGDALLLAEEFLARLDKQHRRDVRLGDVARSQLAEYAWPGNVRELEHVIARAFLLAEREELGDLQLPEPAAKNVAPGESIAKWPAIALAEAEARTIKAVLEATGGDKTKAARMLGISRTALYEKLKRMP